MAGAKPKPGDPPPLLGSCGGDGDVSTGTVLIRIRIQGPVGPVHPLSCHAQSQEGIRSQLDSCAGVDPRRRREAPGYREERPVPACDLTYVLCAGHIEESIPTSPFARTVTDTQGPVRDHTAACGEVSTDRREFGRRNAGRLGQNHHLTRGCTQQSLCIGHLANASTDGLH